MKKRFSLITILTVIFVSLILGFFVNALVAKPVTINKAPAYISYTEAKEMAQNYNIYRRQNMLNAYVKQACAHIPNGSTEETKSVWFSYNDLQGFLNDIVTANKGVPTTNLGIRIYFGVYDDADAVTPDNPYPNRMTMFFVPTVKTVTAGITSENDEVSSTSNLLSPPLLNHGKLCPPDTCSGGKF